ncbi:MAG: hypothetical protein ACK5XI_05155, partial [Hyphomonadaceae bacterium]
CSPRCSRTILTARSRTSGENVCLVRFLSMALPFSGFRASGKSSAVHINLKVIKQLGRYFLMSHHHQIPRKSMKPVNHDPQTLTTTSFSTISAEIGLLKHLFFGE